MRQIIALGGGRFSMEPGNPLLGKKTFLQGAAIMENGRRVWKTFIDVETDEERFVQIGKDFEKTHHVKKGYVGNAECRLMKQRELVDFTFDWLKRNEAR
ncbi:hypothetical protein H839_10428 [Parageobacillus genomosp. 1]|uniref:Aminoglycoside N(3)-acetyltransferase n=1 Tax=Parageobacillus genomosp. 1 TaxID=1295642 RepID=A0ABC9VEX5_9BACL|nr:AAC(3) family N-acetyltransferase [Parageobacillus genomosp. 1]EZP77006.1 hypothetical protein H839_10428 [Parageobacillus genomosp. 1]